MGEVRVENGGNLQVIVMKKQNRNCEFVVCRRFKEL